MKFIKAVLYKTKAKLFLLDLNEKTSMNYVKI